MANKTSLRTYAEAYVHAITEQTDAIREIVRSYDVLKNTQGLASYLEDKSIPIEDKQKALMIALADTAEETQNFILLLSQVSLLPSLPSIIPLVKEAFAEREQRTYAEVTSAVPLTNDETTRIANALGTNIGKPVLLETQIDETILGGIRIKVGDWVYDASVSGRIQRLKNTLHV